MKIDPFSSVRSASSAEKKKRSAAVSGGGDFARLLDAEEAGGEEQVAQVASVTPLASLSGMLALQEVPDEEIRRKKAVKQGRLTLDAL